MKTLSRTFEWDLMTVNTILEPRGFLVIIIKEKHKHAIVNVNMQASSVSVSYIVNLRVFKQFYKCTLKSKSTLFSLKYK